MKAYTEFVDFIVTGMPPEQILGFQASEGTRERVRYLLAQEKQGLISGEKKVSWMILSSLNTSYAWLKHV